MLLILAGCSRHRPIHSFFHWESMVEEADSAIVALERDLTGAAPDSVFASHLGLLKRIADRDPGNRQMKARCEYWSAVRNSFNGSDAVTHIRSAVALCDSIGYPYDMARFRVFECILTEDNSFRKYICLKNYRDYFMQSEDMYMCAVVDMYLGEILMEIRDPERANIYYSEADSLVTRLKIHDWQVKTRLNNANIKHELGNKGEALEILNSLLLDRTTLRDTSFHASVLINKYAVTEDTSLLMQAEKLLGHKLWTDARWSINYSLADMYASNGDSANSVSCLNNILFMADHELNTAENRYHAYQLGARIYDSLGMPDSADVFCRRIYKIQDSVIYERDAYNILNSEAQSEIEINEKMMESRFKIERLWLLLAIVTVLLLAGIILFINYHRLQKHKLKELRSRMQLERERRKVVTSAIAMTEKDNILESVISDIAEIRNSENMPQSLDRLEQNLKMHLSGRQDWEEFKIVFEKVHPRFSSLLKERYPDLTEGDIRLAIYIRSGLSSKQISRMLFLQPDSVKKNRQRLRRHLNLNPQESLEDMLRGIRFPPPDK